MTEILKLTYGIYPKTEKLRIRLGRWGRGALATSELEKLILEETVDFQARAREHGIDAFTDPLFNWYDIFRPLAVIAKGIELGPLTRYGETNTFYRLPEIRGKLETGSNPDKYAEVSDNPPLPLYHVDQGEDQLSFLPGPETFFHYCGNVSGMTFEKFSEELGIYYSSLLSKFKFARTFVFESVPFSHDDLSAFYSSVNPEKVILFTTGNLDGTTLSTAGKKFHSVITNARGGDFEIACDYSRIPGLGLLDAHNTKLENPGTVTGIAVQEGESAGAGKLYVTHTNYLDFLPRQIADKKLELMGRIGE